MIKRLKHFLNKSKTEKQLYEYCLIEYRRHDAYSKFLELKERL